MLTLPSKSIFFHSLLLTFLLALVIPISSAAPAVNQASSEQLDNVQWEDGNDLPTWNSRQPSGGRLTSVIGQLPDNWRRFGPGTPNALTPVLESLNLPLLGIHPIEGGLIPMLASHWYHDAEAQRFYYRIDEQALWSDGIPVTSADIAFTLFFLTDPRRMTPYQGQLIDDTISAITVYDPSHFSIDYKLPLFNSASNLINPNTLDARSLLLTLRPMPSHHYQSGHYWPGSSELAIIPAQEPIPEPVTGPYAPIKLDDDAVLFERIEDWWGNSQRYLAKRFTLAEVSMIESSPKTFKRFAEGSVDLIESSHSTAMTSPWLEKIAVNYQISRASIALDTPDQVMLIADERVSPTTFQQLKNQLEQRQQGLTPAKETTLDIELIYPNNNEFSWLASVNKAKALSNDQYELAIRTGNYDAALVIIPPTATMSWQRLFSFSLADKSVAVIYDIPYHHYAYWDWIKLPNPKVATGNKDWFSPFDAIRGGMISIDRKRKAKTLDKPTRNSEDTPGVIFYPANLTQ